MPLLCCQDSSDSDSEPRLRTRNTRPEVFTFDLECVSGSAGRAAPKRSPARRARRVLYPAKVRRYLPPPETDRPLRCLYLLCLLLLLQICCEEAEELGLTAGTPTATMARPAWAPTAAMARPTGAPHG
ncbi:Zgc 158343, partial [Pristimantis euphronides]